MTNEQKQNFIKAKIAFRMINNADKRIIDCKRTINKWEEMNSNLLSNQISWAKTRISKYEMVKSRIENYFNDKLKSYSNG